MSALEDICLGGKKRSNGSLSFLSRHHVHGILFLSGTTELFAIQIHAYIELLKQAAVSDEDGNRSRFTHKVIECSTGSVTVKSKWDSHNNNPKNNSENIGESSFEIVHVEGQDMIHDFTLAPKFLFVPQTQVAETEIAYFILEALKKV